MTVPAPPVRGAVDFPAAAVATVEEDRCIAGGVVGSWVAITSALSINVFTKGLANFDNRVQFNDAAPRMHEAISAAL